MKINLHLVLSALSLLVAMGGASAQPFSIDRFTVAGGGGTSTGGTFVLSGTVGQHDASPPPKTGGGFSLKGGFWAPFEAPTPRVPITIFDNFDGTLNGAFLATTSTWLASKFCLGSQPYQLDSVVLLLGVPGFDVRSSSVRLQIFSNDPASGKPLASTGAIMNLSGMTNPVSLSPNLPGRPVTWIPATPFTLLANRCYWAVLSVESGSIVRQGASPTKPTGDAGTLGRVGSTDAGVTWGVPDAFFNGIMLIRGTPSAPPPALVVSAVNISGNQLRFSFPTSAGQTYVVESRAALAIDLWTEVPGTRQTSAGAAFEVSLPIRQSQPQQFYRVKQLP